MEVAKSKRARRTTHRSQARFTARVLPGARPVPHPGFVEPCVPVLKPAVPTGERWLYEIKYDGYRLQAHLRGGRPALLTSSGLNWTGRFRSIAGDLVDLPANNLIVDGEVAVPNEHGVADFSLLQEDLSTGRSDRMRYYAFDLLYLDGFDIRAASLIDRRNVLAALLGPKRVGHIAFSAHTEGDGNLIYEHACGMELEGLVCKLRDAPYRSGKNHTWLKVKCTQRGSFAIVGFVPAQDAIAALHLARREGRGLVYAGKVGTGFSRRAAHELRQRLDPLATRNPALKLPVREPQSVWVRPELDAMIHYRSITADGLLRHAAYKGMIKRKSA